MLDVLAGLFDPTGFPPRKSCGTNWTSALIWLHVSSDLFIWLAYVSIPLVLLYFTKRRDLPFPRLFVLFALFILACGTTHLIDALMFEYPIYRFAGVMKLVTAVVSWVTVIALIPIVPRVMWAVSEATQPGADTRLHRPLPAGRPAKGWGRWRDYIVAILAAVLAILVRGALDSSLKGDQIFVVALLAVVYVSWQYGFGPGITCLCVGLAGYAFFFLPPRYTFVLEGFGSQMAVALFFFCGVACAALGESQRTAQRRARRALINSVNRQEELETEVARRRVVEAALRQRESDLLAAERETAEALARLNAFLDNAPLGIAFVNPELRYVHINPFLAAANGKPVAEHLGHTLPEVLPDYPREKIALYKRVAGPDGIVETIEIQRKDARRPGETRVWDVTAFPVRSSDNRIIGAGVITQDVTDRLRAEEDLRRSEARFRTLTEAVPQMVWTADPKGTVQFANRRWEEFTGQPLNESTLGWGAGSIFPEDLDRVRGRWQLAVMSPSEEFSEEFRLRRVDGEFRWMLSVAVPRRDSGGAVVEWVGTVTDIDDQKQQTHTLERMVRERTSELEKTNTALTNEIEERKAIEEQLRGVAAELVRSNDELEKFAYIASHDLQEPLRKIQAFGDRLRDKCRDILPDLAREYLDRMLTAAARMRRLIDDLLSFSRVTTQRKPFHLIDLGKLVEEVVSDLDVRIAQAGGNVNVGSLPKIEADPTQMRQLFQNLIANAVKFQRPGVPPVVEVASELVNPPSAGQDSDEAVALCHVTVKDNGIGFNEKYRDRIFEMFQRLHRRDEYEGTGVGLAICRKIVERHGGTITARSREGDGATFVVTLPVRQLHAQERKPPDVQREQTDHDLDRG